MQKHAIYSAILHAIVFILLLVGIPFPQRHVDVSEQPIILEFTKIDTISKAPVLSPENSNKDTKKLVKKAPAPAPTPEEKPEEKAEDTPKAEAKKEEAKPEPKDEKTPEKSVEKDTPSPVKEKEPKAEETPEPTPVPKKDPPKKEKPKEEKKKPEPEKDKKKDTTKDKAKKEVKNDKAVVDLKKKKDSAKPLAKTKAKPLSTSKSADELIDSLLSDDEETGQKSAPAQMVGDEITATDIDAIRERIYKCWLVPPGAKDGGNLVVDVNMQISREGIVEKADVVNKERMGDAAFEAAAESAQRAVLDPNCNPLPLPVDKYDQWKSLTLRFNPKDMY